MLWIRKAREYPIFHVKAKKTHTLGMHFMRYQEFVEGEGFIGTPFTWEEYMDWYALKRPGATGEFTYLQDISGYNLSSIQIKEGYVSLPQKTEAEKRLYTSLHLMGAFKQNSSIVGTSEEDEALIHELCHAFYQLDEEYYLRVNSIIDKYHNKLKTLKKRLLTVYTKEDLYNELQAYALENYGSCLLSNLRYTKEMRKFREELAKEVGLWFPSNMYRFFYPYKRYS